MHGVISNRASMLCRKYSRLMSYALHMHASHVGSLKDSVLLQRNSNPFTSPPHLTQNLPLSGVFSKTDFDMPRILPPVRACPLDVLNRATIAD
jgi:hypothetical protein